MAVSVFCGASLDGFIARPDDGLDFLEAGASEPHGYEAFFASVDVVVMGRRTYEVVLTLGAWPFGSKRVVVLSGRPLDLSAVKEGMVERMAGTPAEIVDRLTAEGARNIYVDGGATIQGFLRAGLVDRLIVTRVPVLIGEGIPLLGPLGHDVRLRLVRTEAFHGGLVQSEYDVLR